MKCECGCGQETTIHRGVARRFIHGHNARRALDHAVDPATGCWLWRGGGPDAFYGSFRRDGRKIGAHRYFYEREHGPIPPGMVIDHLCVTPACVNPDHLEVVTVAENTRRGKATKLTEAEAAAIRTSTERGRDLARRFGVSQSTVCDIRKGRSWGPDGARARRGVPEAA